MSCEQRNPKEIEMTATCVYVDGPFSNATARSHWDEYPEWTVSLCDDDGEPTGNIDRYHSRHSAFNAGAALAEKYNVELVNEAGSA